MKKICLFLFATILCLTGCSSNVSQGKEKLFCGFTYGNDGQGGFKIIAKDDGTIVQLIDFSNTYKGYYEKNKGENTIDQFFDMMLESVDRSKAFYEPYEKYDWIEMTYNIDKENYIIEASTVYNVDSDSFEYNEEIQELFKSYRFDLLWDEEKQAFIYNDEYKEFASQSNDPNWTCAEK